MDRISSAHVGSLVRHIAPPQILQHERGFAIFFALVFFLFWALPLWGPVLVPAVFAYFVATYNLYWTAQALYGTWCALVSYRRMQQWTRIDWRSRYEQTGQTVQQVVVIPNFNERFETLSATLERLAASQYPREHLNVVLAMEEREEGAHAKAERLRERFAEHFAHFWITYHALTSAETAGKGANLSYAVQYVKKQCDESGWDLASVMVTTIDADTRLHPQYLAALAERFLSTPDPTGKFYQGVLLLLNNIWDVHAPIRVLSAFWTFTYLAGATHYQRMTTAVYSMSLRLLEDTGYWDPRVVAEDGHVFFRAFFALKGRPAVVPLYLPIGLDAVCMPSLWQALRVQYKQMMRWAWAASNLPFIADALVQHREIPLARKLAGCLPYFEGLLIIPSSWFVITFGVLLPPLINPQTPMSVFGIPLAVLAPLILSPTLIGVAAALALNLKLRAQYADRDHSVSLPLRMVQSLEWLLMALSAVFYFGIPYVQAYWRLLSGNDLHYETTPK